MQCFETNSDNQYMKCNYLNVDRYLNTLSVYKSGTKTHILILRIRLHTITRNHMITISVVISESKLHKNINLEPH